MRQVKEFATADGKRFRVRFRQGGTQTSQTFRRRQDAHTFATILDGGGVPDALAWLDARDSKASATTFAEWHEHYVTQLTGITPRTRDDYRSLRRRYLAELDPLPLPLITRSHVSTIVNRLDAEEMSPKTIRNVIHMLSSCLALAVDEGHITRNPCRRVRLPKKRIDSTEARFLTHEEFGALVAEIPEHYRPFVVFLVGTGLRWSEATALQGRHVNLAAGTVRVDRAWKRVSGGFEIGAPKTEKSTRTVNAAVLALAAARQVMRGPNDLLFTTPSGGVIAHSNFYGRVWKPACERSGVNARIHDLRHTHASWLISDGIQLEAVQDQLGHESILTTRKVYGHLLPALGVAVGQSASAALDMALPDGLQGRGRPLILEPSRDADQTHDPHHVAPHMEHNS